MYPYKITLISQEVLNLSLLIQKINVTSKRIACFYYNNTELQNYERACPSRYKDRSSRLEVFCKKGVLGNFAKFTGKHLCQRLFFNKVAGLKPATLLKKSLWHRCFPVNFAKFLRTPFFTEHLRWLLL